MKKLSRISPPLPKPGDVVAMITIRVSAIETEKGLGVEIDWTSMGSDQIVEQAVLSVAKAIDPIKARTERPRIVVPS